MKGAYAVFGAGSFGSKVATELSEAGHHVVVVDIDREAVTAISEKVTEALGRGRIKAYIFVHMKGVDALPRYAFIGDKGGEHLVLRGRGGKYHVYLRLFTQKLLYFCRNILRGVLSHFGAGVVNIDFKFIFYKTFHG